MVLLSHFVSLWVRLAQFERVRHRLQAGGTLAAEQVRSVWVGNVVLGCVDCELVVHAENFSLSESFVFVLPLLQLLKLKMPAQTFNDDDLVSAVLNLRIDLWLEGALLQLCHFFLSPFHRYFLLLFF